MWERLKRIPQTLRRFVGSGALAVLVLVVGAPAAFAKGLGQTPPALAWITLTDTHGIPLWNHELSIDRGGMLAPDKTIYAYTTDQIWGAYRSFVAVALWFLDWVMSFQWLNVLAGPMLLISDALQSVVGRLGLTATFLTITMVVAAVLMLRGRVATGLYEIGVALLVAALATGVLVNPVKLVVGDNGYVANANRLGQEISNSLTSASGGSGSSAEQSRQRQVGTMVDVFIRQPLQMINYGQVLDGGKCEGAYDEVVKDGPYGGESTIRDKIAACDSALGEVAASPNGSMATSASIFMPAGYLVVTLLMLVAGSVVAAGAWAVYQSLKGIWALLQGTLPGSSRGMLFSTVGGIIEALVTIIVANIFLGITMLVLQAVFGQPGSVGQRFVIADIIIAVAIVVWVRARKRMKAMGRRLAEWMSQRPGGSPTKIPAGQQRSGKSALGTAGRVAMQAWQMKQMKGMSAGQPGVTNNNMLVVMGPPQAMSAAGRGGYAYQTGTVGTATQGADPTGQARALDGGARRQLAAGGGVAGDDGGPTAMGPGGAGGMAALPAGKGLARIEQRNRGKGMIRPIVQTAASLALAAATGGTSAAVAGASRAAIVVRNTRRAALVARLSKQAITGAARSVSRTGGHRPALPAQASISGTGKATPAATGPAPVVTGRVIDAPTPVTQPNPPAPRQRPLEPKPGKPVPAPAVQRARTADVNAARAEQFRSMLATRMRRTR